MRITTVFVVALMLLASNLLAADFVELKDVSGKHIIKVEINKVTNGKVQVTDEKGKTAEYSLGVFDRGSLILILNAVAKMKDIQKPDDPPRPLNVPVKDFRLLQTLKGHTSFVFSVAFSPDGKRIVSGSHDETVKIWDANTGKVIQSLTGHTGGVWCVAYSPDGKRIISGSSDKTIKFWDADTGALLQTLTGHTSVVNSVAYSPDGKRIISGSHDKTIKFWDANTGKVIAPEVIDPLLDPRSSVRCVAFSPDGRIHVCVASDIMLFKTGNVVQRLKGYRNGSPVSVAFSPDSKRIVSGSSPPGESIEIWDANTGKLLQTLTGHTLGVWCVAYSPDGKRIISGSYSDKIDRTIKIWDANTGKLLQTLTGHTSRIRSVAFSPDGTRIVSGSEDHRIKIWDASEQVK